MRLPGIEDWKRGVGSRKLNISAANYCMSVVLTATISQHPSEEYCDIARLLSVEKQEKDGPDPYFLFSFVPLGIGRLPLLPFASPASFEEYP